MKLPRGIGIAILTEIQVNAIALKFGGAPELRFFLSIAAAMFVLWLARSEQQ